jgi:hypothetical protein
MPQPSKPSRTAALYATIALLVLVMAALLSRLGSGPNPSPVPVPETASAPSTQSTRPTRLQWTPKNIERLSLGTDASAWLKSCRNPAGFAPQRFGTPKQALRFVEMLKAAGAVKVIVPDEAIVVDEDGPYADALVVYLPADPQRRKALREMCNIEIVRSHGDPADQKNADAMLLWWE